MDLVTLNKDTKREKYKTQIHHIIPRCYYKIIGEKINNNKDNLVNLQYKSNMPNNWDWVVSNKYQRYIDTNIRKDLYNKGE